MPQIQSPEEAQSVARLIKAGQITGAARDSAMQALRDFDTGHAQPSPAQAAVAAQSPAFARQLGMDTQHPIGSGELFGGMAKTLAGGVAHGVGTLVDVATGTGPGEGSYAERFASPFQVTGRLAELDPDQQQMHAAVSRGLDRAIGTGPLAQTVRERVPQAFEAATTAVPILRGASGGVGAFTNAAAARAALPQTAEAVMARQAAASPTNMGAAAAAPSLTSVSPELRQAIVRTAQKTGGAVNTETLARHVEAETLPVPIRLLEGQATQDPVLLSEEMNLRGKHNQLATHINEQNTKLIQNVQAIRDEVGPDVFSTNTAEHGDTLIAAYRAKNDAAQTQVTAAYKALKDANGGQFPVDAKALLDTASAQLHQGLLYDHAPKAIMSTLTRLADTGRMTFENYESLRTNLARIQRSLTADGNEKAAAGVIRDAMEALPLAPEAGALKPLADRARAAARAQFQALEADPAYKAAVTDSVPPDRFVNRFIINAPRDDVTLMRQNLGHDPAATQTMGVSALDHLRSSARIDADWNGNFSQAGFNKGLQALSPKLQALLDPKTAGQLENLGNVARYTQFQPRGSFVNNSNTFVASAADYGAGALEGAANVAFKGIPVGTWGRRIAQNVTAGRRVQQAMAPGAGLGRLQTTSPRMQAMLDAAERKAAQQMVP